ncbi:MAG: hypothetical protein IJ424_01295 [Oscillospiraceae bacterium]|nr:hypothetical protein [Oscillospiraceae bacterium]
MKKLIKAIIISLVQLAMFYIFPLFAGPTDAMGMVFIIIIATFLLSLIMGIIYSSVEKYCYPALVAILFIPSVLIYYNGSAFVHAVWYLVVSAVGIAFGSLTRSIVNMMTKKQT